jgi:3',5'-cyclic-nucleotide phosphodiesterase
MTVVPRLVAGAIALAVCLAAGPGAGQPAPAFVAVVLGAGGGPGQDDMSAYLLAPAGSSDFVALDAGTLLSGIRTAWAAGSFRGIGPPGEAALAPAAWILRERVKAYLISHAHLDHVAGLVIDSPEDASKEILGLPATIDMIRDHLFNWRVWPNFGDEGPAPLKKFRYVRLAPGRAHPIAGTVMTVEPFELSHSGVTSTAFLVRAGGAAALYVGDTGPDAVEGSDRLKALWTRMAPLARDGSLRAIFLEVSYADGRPDHLLFGHLTPIWLMREVRRLAELVDPAGPTRALRRLTLVVTHIKPALDSGPGTRERIARQVGDLNDLGMPLVVARQGQRIEF